MYASIALKNISCSFCINFASVKFNPNLLFSYSVFLPLPSIIVCSSLIEADDVSTSVTDASAPACVVISFVSSKFFLPVSVKVGN